jgi:hypothetical protein
MSTQGGTLPEKSLELDRAFRVLVEKAVDLAPGDSLRGLERWARGLEESRKLAQADYAIVSFGKSGRTWLNVMLSKYFQLRYRLPDYVLFQFDNLHRLNGQIPKVLFTHDNYIRDFKRNGTSKTPFYDKRTMVLARHPADTAVSLYFHWQHRMRPHKKVLNKFPPHGAEISMFDFVMYPTVLPWIVDFLNEWARELPRVKNHFVTRYEDLRSQPLVEVDRMLRWMGQEPMAEDVKAAVDFASFDNLKKLEANDAFSGNTKRLSPGDVSNPDSFKVRRAKVGGYRDYFDDEQVRQIETYIRTRLDPSFGYEVQVS